ncbi:hypothetical protein [Edaphobacter flagellatus]|uniref:hypothetical protein n=1 Tax=Edaphobacter flagellatus TaxID=1933044 RepID=UPI0021B4A40C|nr:hypothetical protein [Edaphobacter flagellatus]
MKSNIRLLRNNPGRYNSYCMDILIHLVAKLVVPLFFIGLAGSSVVIVVSFVEDLQELLEDED